MAENYEIDSVDRKILEILQQDARIPYLEIARKLIVSGGTIHQRIDKMKKLGIIKGSRIEVDYSKLGYDVSVLLGIHLKSAKDQNKVIAALRKMPEVTEVYYTTGTFALIVKIVTKNIQEFHLFLTNKLQSLDEVQATESFICLDSPIHRELNLNKSKA